MRRTTTNSLNYLEKNWTRNLFDEMMNDCCGVRDGGHGAENAVAAAVAVVDLVSSYWTRRMFD